jgi:hypothetical protein
MSGEELPGLNAAMRTAEKVMEISERMPQYEQQEPTSRIGMAILASSSEQGATHPAPKEPVAAKLAEIHTVACTVPTQPKIGMLCAMKTM